MDVFSGFGDFASLRAIGFLLLVAIAQYALMAVLLLVFAGGVIDWYMTVMQASAAGTPPTAMTSLPDGMGLAVVVLVVLGLLMYAVQAVGLCQIALRGRGVFGAVADGVAGAFKNLLPLFMLLLAMIVAMVVVVLGVLLLGLLVGVLAKIAGAWLAIVLAVPLYIAALLVAYVITFGLMYYVWRDVCGEGPGPVAMDEALTA